MSDLNNRIKAWRSALASEMSVAELDELEDHLRQTLASLPEDSLSFDERFLVAARRLGEPQSLVAEFAMAREARVRPEHAVWMAFLGVVCLGIGSSVGLATLYNLDERFVGHLNEWLPQPVMIRICFALLMTGLGSWSLWRGGHSAASGVGSAETQG